jgi:hypothetical protein
MLTFAALKSSALGMRWFGAVIYLAYYESTFIILNQPSTYGFNVLKNTGIQRSISNTVQECDANEA